MWKRKTLKQKARTLLRTNYWRVISVCFLAAMLAGAYPTSMTFLGSQASIPSIDRQVSAPFSPEFANSELVSDIAAHFFRDTAVSDFFRSSDSSVAGLVVDLTSTSVSAFFSILRAVNNFLSENWHISTVLLILGVLISFVYQFFIRNIIIVGEKRFFLETHSYKQTTVSTVFFLYRLRCLKNPAWVMFCRSFFQFLWNLTIIGGVIKHYEYIMIPYIIAENPRISRKNAFFLSRQLMQHNKWRLFLLQLSLFGWKVLSLLTLGVLDVLYVNPYMTGCEAELYRELRRNYVLSRSARYEHLNDSYLEHVPSEDELLISKALYDDSNGPYTKISYFAPEQYPRFLFSVQPSVRAVKPALDPSRKYGLTSLIFLFHAFSIFGWLVEAVIQLLANGSLEGVSFLFGTWLPLYGVYGTLILLLVKRLARNPVYVFLANFAIYSVLEYSASCILELLTGTAPWDYSGYFLNLDGRIYVGGSAAVALFGCAFLYCLAPIWGGGFCRLKKPFRILLCIVLTLIFLAVLPLSWLIFE